MSVNGRAKDQNPAYMNDASSVYDDAIKTIAST